MERTRVRDTQAVCGFRYLASKFALQKLRLRPLGCRSFDDFESQLGGFPLEITDLLLAMLRLVELRSAVHELHSVAQHAVDQSGQLGCHGLDRDRSSKLSSESTELGPQIGVAESQGAGRHL